MIPDELLKQIGKMDADTIEKLTDAVFERKRELFPQWDIVYLTLPKNNWEENGSWKWQINWRNVFGKNPWKKNCQISNPIV